MNKSNPNFSGLMEGDSLSLTGDLTLTGNTQLGNAKDTDILTLRSILRVKNSIDNDIDITNAELAMLKNCSSNIQNQLQNKVDLTSDNLFTGINNYVSGTLRAATQSQNDNSTKVATTAYTDLAISNLISSAPNSLNTLNELATALGNDQNYATTITTALATKATKSSANTFTGLNEFQNDTTLNKLILSGNIVSNTATITNQELSYINGVSSSIQTQLNQKLNSNNPVITGSLDVQGGLSCDSLIVDTSQAKLDKDVRLGGTNTTNSFTTTINSNTLTINSASINLPNNSISSSAINNNDVFVNRVGTQTVTGQKSFSNDMVIGATNANTLTINSKISVDASLITPTEISSLNGIGNTKIIDQLNSKPSLSSTNAFSGFNTFSTDTTLNKLILTGNLVLNSGATTVTNSELCNINGTTSNIQTQINNKCDDTAAVKLTGTQVIAGNKQFTGRTTLENSYLNGVMNITSLMEQITPITVTSNACSVNIGSNNSLIYITPSSSSNITATINIISFLSTQLSASFCGSITVTYLINVATNKQYISTVSFGGSNYTPIFSGGLANVSINALAVWVLQTISLVFINSATPTKVISSVSSLF
jgi:hypothetical protein